MTKKQVQARVLHCGQAINPELFTWDADRDEFRSSESGLVIDFEGIYGCSFHTGCRCTFSTGDGCEFTTAHDCTFSTGHHCLWHVDGVAYTFAPLFMQGARWRVSVPRPGYLKIGCKTFTFFQWGRNKQRIAAEEVLSIEELGEYYGYIRVARMWAILKGWLKPIT